MTLEELLSNEELRRHEFPVTAQKIYLAHAGVCALPRRVKDAIASYATGCTLADQEFVLPTSWLRETRQLAAAFLGATPEETAFVGPTSLALSFVANGLRFRRNENVLVYQDDFPSAVYPWMTLADRGVQVRFLNIREYGCVRARDVIGQVDENTRFVALGSCHYVAGYRLELDEIGAFLRSRNILFCVDGIQTLGAFPTSLAHVDFLAADAHKWLLGPLAAGLMFVRREAQEKLRPTSYGWHNLRCPNYVALDDLDFKPDARRYEAGSHNFLGLVGLRASLELLAELGVEKIARELLRKRALLVPALQEKGFTVLAANAPAQNASGIISFYKEGADLPAIHAHLESNGIVTSLRVDRGGRRYIRLSPHFYNTDAELHRFLELL